MTTKIAAILEGERHCKKIKRIQDELDLSFPIYGPQEITRSGLELYEFVQQLILLGTEVIISAGKYAETLMKSVSVPIIKIHRSKVSFATAVKEARSYSSRVAILARDGVFYNAAMQYKATFNDDIPAEKFVEDQDIPDVLARLKAQDIRVLVTGSRGTNYATQVGFRCIGVPFEEEDILAAIHEAEHILQYVEMKLEHSQILQAIQNNIIEGIIALNDEGIITEINQPALEIFSLEKSDVINKNLLHTPFSPIAELPFYQQNRSCSGELFRLNGISISISLSPIIVSGVKKALLISFNQTEQIQKNERNLRIKLYSKGHVANYTFDKIIGSSPCMRQTIDEAKKYAVVDSTILLNGPSGSGKEVFAQSIHNFSSRRNHPFVVINCASLPESLLESILFGYEKGAYTGALKEGKKGLFEIAHGGTVFLDEISEMSLPLQSRFLRVIQEKEITPVGSSQVIPIDIRILSATNRNIEKMVQDGLFREDLFYRIAVLWLNIPPLDQRKEDIPLLIRYFLASKSLELKIPQPELSFEVLQYLCHVSYPGNIRQLNNVAERLLVLSGGRTVSLELAQRAYGSHPYYQEQSQAEAENKSELEMLTQALAICKGNRAKTAAMQKISVTTLWRKMKHYHLT